jgi:hypothetical protein
MRPRLLRVGARTCSDILASCSKKPSVTMLMPRYSAMSRTSCEQTVGAAAQLQLRNMRARDLRRDGGAQALRGNAEVLGNLLNLTDKCHAMYKAAIRFYLR